MIGVTMTKPRSSRRPTNGRAGVAVKGPVARKNSVVRNPDMPTTARGKQKREQLKAAAARVLERIGYRNMRLADIAAEAGVPMSLLYHYFSGTAQVTEEVLTDLLSQVTDATAGRLPAQDAFGAILLANQTMVDAYSRSPGLMRCLLHFDEDAAGFSKLYRAESHNWNLRVARNILGRFPNQSLEISQALMIAYALGGMFDSFLFELYVDRNPELAKALPDTERVAIFLAIIWYRSLYLRNPPEKYLTEFSWFKSLSEEFALFPSHHTQA
jgi:TetR/AcrR family transcriptional regulator, ethionamide resistance regulator